MASLDGRRISAFASSAATPGRASALPRKTGFADAPKAQGNRRPARRRDIVVPEDVKRTEKETFVVHGSNLPLTEKAGNIKQTADKAVNQPSRTPKDETPLRRILSGAMLEYGFLPEKREGGNILEWRDSEGRNIYETLKLKKFEGDERASALVSEIHSIAFALGMTLSSLPAERFSTRRDGKEDGEENDIHPRSQNRDTLNETFRSDPGTGIRQETNPTPGMSERADATTTFGNISVENPDEKSKRGEVSSGGHDERVVHSAIESFEATRGGRVGGARDTDAHDMEKEIDRRLHVLSRFIVAFEDAVVNFDEGKKRKLMSDMNSFDDESKELTVAGICMKLQRMYENSEISSSQIGDVLVELTASVAVDRRSEKTVERLARVIGDPDGILKILRERMEDMRRLREKSAETREKEEENERMQQEAQNRMIQNSMSWGL